MWKFLVPKSASGWHSTLELHIIRLSQIEVLTPVEKKRLLEEVTPWRFSDTHPVVKNEVIVFWEHIM